MKKVLGVIILIGCLFVVGCKAKELTVTFEDYGIYDINEGKDITERINVSIEGNEISKADISTILDKLENKNMHTELVIENVQGVEIAKAKEIDKSVSIEIKKEYQVNYKSEVKVKGLDRYKEFVKDIRSQVKDVFIENVDEWIEGYKDISDSMTKDLIEEMPANLAMTSVGKKGMDLTALKAQSKDFLDDDELKQKYDKLLEAHSGYLNMVKYAEIYTESEKSEDLDNYKKSVYEYKEIFE